MRSEQSIPNTKHQTPNTKHYTANRKPQTLTILFYAPFKPLGHRHPSGDLVIATGLYQYLEDRGHRLQVASTLRARWIYWKPWMLPRFLAARRRLRHRRLPFGSPDLWLTYHAYYKGPDLLGPSISAARNIPYVVFQGAYATKYRRDIRTVPGFYLNRTSLQAARHVFVNKQVDLVNLTRLLPPERISYVAPGIRPEEFRFDAARRASMRSAWQTGETTVLLTAAMLRPGVKAQGVAWVIRACGTLVRRGHNLKLVIVGDGAAADELEQLAEAQIPGKYRFVGKISRSQMFHYYSGADVFVFPGIGESLGMVYLEAQACRLPVVAMDNTGVPEVVLNGKTGLLTPLNETGPFVQAVEELVLNTMRRREMGIAAEKYIRRERDLATNYAIVEEVLKRVAAS
jgi:glycosyltransferase involved in cell wall biosynthesis